MLFEGNRIDLGFGVFGYDRMPTSTSIFASPPWTQRGGPGRCYVGHCWYSFGVDNHGTWGHPEKNWPTLPNGLLLLNPDSAFASRVSGLVGQHLGMRYNPFLPGPTTPPCCTTVDPLSVSIEGPTVVGSGNLRTWTAVVTGGRYPYSYSWSFPLESTEATTSGSICSDATLTLQVTDANGTLVSISFPIQVVDPDPAEPQYPCMQ